MIGLILKIDDWVFDSDMEQTMAYSAAEAAEHCACAYCRNFYIAVDAHYPNLRPFLGQFGVDIASPEEQMPYDINGKMYYDSIYMVSGKVTQEGKCAIGMDGLLIKPTTVSETDGTNLINYNCPAPCFALDISTVVLPWVLDEPLKETVSPANSPSFLRRMWQRLLKKANRSDAFS